MRGKRVSTDLKYTIIALGDFHSVSEIEALTGVSRRQIYRIREVWESTGCVEPERARKKTGRPRFLTKDEETVSSLLHPGQTLTRCPNTQYVVECVRRTPDIYLEDLQSQIVTNLGVKVSRKLIWETLRRNGLTMKKVSATHPFRLLKATDVTLRPLMLRRNGRFSSGPSICSECHNGTRKTSWSLLMRRLLTVALPTVVMRGRQRDKRHLRRSCFAAASGKWFNTNFGVFG